MYFVYFTVFLCKSVVWIGILLLLCRQILPLVSKTETEAERVVNRISRPIWLLGVWVFRMLGFPFRAEGLEYGCITAEILLGWALLCLGLVGLP